jgi:tRNA A-37 threonylcarbamoyl transferase component Bud32
MEHGGEQSLSAYGVELGAVLSGKYRVEGMIGEGGMGAVLAARHLQLDRAVAIKLLQPEALAHPELIARFVQEARAVVKLTSEHVVRVLDVGMLDSGAPYMVMERLEGEDLARRVGRLGRLPIDEAVDFALQTCEGIADVHALGIVHRDIKPANLFVVRRNDGSACLKILDFGISKATGLAAAGMHRPMTKTAISMGSPSYISPEQLRSARDVDHRTDIWALGVVLYELLAGFTPFRGANIAEIGLKIFSENPAPVRAQRPEVPAGLEAAILRCLQKEPSHRYGHVGELAAALALFAPPQARAAADRIARVMAGPVPVFGSTGSAPPAAATPVANAAVALDVTLLDPSRRFPPSPSASSTATAVRPSAAQPEAVQASGTNATWGTTLHATRSRGWVPAMLVVGVALALAGGLVTVAALRTGDDGTAPATASAPAPTPVLTAANAPITPEPRTEDTAAVVLPVQSAEAVSAPVTAAPPPAVSAPPRPKRVVTTRPTESKKAPAKLPELGY